MISLKQSGCHRPRRLNRSLGKLPQLKIRVGRQRAGDRSPMHATLANVILAVEASNARWEIAPAGETRVGPVVPRFSAADERARRIWPAVRATMSPGTPE